MIPGITVIVPTFKRPVDLDRCLAALDRQRLQPAEILITYRPEDEATQAYLARRDRPGLSARLILCDRPGQVYAMTVAIDQVHSEFLAFTDDDAAPQPEWLEMNCAENNPHIRLGKENYFMSGDGYLMPARKDQAPPDLRYFKKAGAK